MKTVIEPFRIKMVEPIHFTSPQERERLLIEAGYNLFQLRAADVIIDLLTDSGTAAMSSNQWAALMRADESYAGCHSYYHFKSTIERIFGFSEIIPVHQGRAAERLLFQTLVQPGQIIPSNNHFDTTRGNIEYLKAQAVDLPISESNDLSSDFPFKGNIDLAAVQSLINRHGRKAIPFGMITITNNSNAGQPVSLQNIADYSELLHRHRIPLYIDAARFAENAWLIKTREKTCSSQSVSNIVKELFSLADGCLLSAKKDGLSNTGGFLALNDKPLADEIRQLLILTEGFPTYGGLSGRDLETIAVGLEEVLSEDYLLYRSRSAEYLAYKLEALGVPIVKPAGLHAIYLDAGRFLSHIPKTQFPGQALACELYLEAGIRTCEIGSVMFGDVDPTNGKKLLAAHELVRLALPRRVYSQSHFDYVIEAVNNVLSRRNQVQGLQITRQSPRLRHFTAQFKPVCKSSAELKTKSDQLQPASILFDTKLEIHNDHCLSS